MKKVLVVLVALAFLAGSSLAAMAAMGPAEIKLPAKMMGTVTFPHAQHQKTVKDCKTCHHKGVAAGACTNCHGKEGSKAPSMKDAAHKLCKGCHAKEHGPTSCHDCHKK
ncbi:MAG: cytochrome c3 family protein [Desulfuromonadales bacterium]|jgi:predicted CXXCH cytochrome family protein